MTVQLSARTLQRIPDLVVSGVYPDADTVVEKALDQLIEYGRLQHVRQILVEASEQVARGEG